MKPVFLIAANFLREHRWPVLLLFAWIVLVAFASAGLNEQRAVPEDVGFYVVQQGIFICIFCAFLAADAIHNDRKSRRILLVLSKAVSRAEYLLAPMLATCVVAVAYSLLYCVCGVYLAARAELPSAGLWPLAILVMVGSVLAASVGLFFSTFLNPYLAVAATLVLFSAPGMLHANRHHWSMWLPGLPVLLQIADFSFTSRWSMRWPLVLLALLQSLLFWILAATIFRRKDISVPVE